MDALRPLRPRASRMTRGDDKHGHIKMSRLGHSRGGTIATRHHARDQLLLPLRHTQ